MLDAAEELIGGVMQPDADELRRNIAVVEVLVLGYCLYTLLASFRIVGITHSQPSAVLELPMSVVYAGYSAMTLLIAGDIVVGWLSGTRREAATQTLASEV